LIDATVPVTALDGVSLEIRTGCEEMGMKRRFIALATLVSALTLFLEVFAMEGRALCQASQRDIEALSKASVIYVATVRKDGNQSTAAPVWFNVTPDRLVLIQTGPTTWKAKRIRRGSPVIAWIGKRDGPAFIGKAEITKDPAVIGRIVDEFPKRYLVARLGLHRPTQAAFEKGDRVAIRITPVRDLPQDFASKPGTPAPSVEGAHAAAGAVVQN
jgi:predicted pyridoxine 5'-phosphate oxidase superfamily flavin-nucleotide-binding protein